MIAARARAAPKRAQLRARLVQVGGFLQRIDYVRKYAFGVMCILKDDKGQFPIRCAPAGAA